MHSARCCRRGRVAQIGWRPATADDLERYYGSRPQTTVKALVGLMDGEPAGVIGIAREQWTARFFSDFKPEFEPYLSSIVIMRGIKAGLELVKNYPADVYAVVGHEKGGDILQRLGFVPTDRENTFVWEN